jgi:hypothetical protein
MTTPMETDNKQHKPLKNIKLNQQTQTMARYVLAFFR